LIKNINAGNLQASYDNYVETDNPQGLKFCQLPDGTFGVAVGNARGLDEIVIPETYKGRKVTEIINKAFDGCSRLRNISIPNGITRIGYRAFNNCYSLTNVSIPESITSIGFHVFANCFRLKSIIIPESVISIENCAFYNCFFLRNVKFNNPNGWAVSQMADMSNAISLTSVDLENTLIAAKYLINARDFLYYNWFRK